MSSPVNNLTWESSVSAFNNNTYFWDPSDLIDWVSIYVYAILSLFGVLGNASIIIIILLNSQLRRSQINILIVQLAIGDLIFILVTVPVKIEHEIEPWWWSGAASCKAYRFSETLAMGICVYSITMFSVGRFLGVVMKPGKLKRGYTGVLVSVEWIIAISIAIPSLFFATLQPNYSETKFFCSFTYTDTSTKVYIVVWSFTLYALPLFIIAYTNILVIVKLLQSTRKFSGEQVNRSLQKQFRIRRNRAAMFILITVSFALFWMPYYVFRFWHIFGSGSPTTPLADMLRKIHYYAAIANSCCNPLVMYMMSSKYRQALCCRLKSGQRSGIASGNNSIRSVRVKTTNLSMSVKYKPTQE